MHQKDSELQNQKHVPYYILLHTFELFWCELPGFGDVCLVFIVMELGGTGIVVPNTLICKTQQQCPSLDNDRPCEVSCRRYFLSG